MGTAFSKGRRSRESSLNATKSSKTNSKSKTSKNGEENGKTASAAPQPPPKTLHANITGSSSSSNHNHPYLNSLNANQMEINTGLTSSVYIPSNSKSLSSQYKNTPAPTQPLRNNTTDKHLNTISMHKLLAFGWIRQNCLSSQLQPPLPLHADSAPHEIPANILELCFEYIYIERMLFCLIASESDKISTIQAIDMNNAYKSQYQISRDVNMGWDTNGICIYSEHDLRLPLHIVRDFKLEPLATRYHALFKCGSQHSRDSKCLLIPHTQFQYMHHKNSYNASRSNIDDNVISAYVWDLPAMPSNIAAFGNAVAYSPQHGLVSIGGAQADAFLGAGSHSGVLQLSWDSYRHKDGDEDYKEQPLRWKSLRRMGTGRAHASSTFINTADGTESLFVCGGDLNGSVEVYNFAENSWRDAANTNVSRECAGIYYDRHENVIYLGGGHGAQKKIECYDVARDEWMIFPNTQCNHDFYPSLFKSSFHYDILYIMSPKSNLCEYIDKREGKWNNAQWNIIYDYELHDRLFRVPEEVDFDQFRFIN
eukprot:CAMPEP_0197078788 /NCGR_PEP_ID=MMETSP1384-20130603/213295_1 /TAXON_ID=29189 /ORGANISM="Ammonia sp." /LENGTH=536 /DNA_ID=CAMNT_0042517657 /DNA_START=28 /DNA_END=1638 /DNA_ORIENTATION=+